MKKTKYRRTAVEAVLKIKKLNEEPLRASMIIGIPVTKLGNTVGNMES